MGKTEQPRIEPDFGEKGGEAPLLRSRKTGGDGDNE